MKKRLRSDKRVCDLRCLSNLYIPWPAFPSTVLFSDARVPVCVHECDWAMSSSCPMCQLKGDESVFPLLRWLPIEGF